MAESQSAREEGMEEERIGPSRNNPNCTGFALVRPVPCAATASSAFHLNFPLNDENRHGMSPGYPTCRSQGPQGNRTIRGNISKSNLFMILNVDHTAGIPQTKKNVCVKKKTR